MQFLLSNSKLEVALLALGLFYLPWFCKNPFDSQDMRVAVIPKKSPESCHEKLCIFVLAGVTVNLLDTNGHLNLSFSSTLIYCVLLQKTDW